MSAPLVSDGPRPPTPPAVAPPPGAGGPPSADKSAPSARRPSISWATHEHPAQAARLDVPAAPGTISEQPDQGRRPSIQFSVASAESTLRNDSVSSAKPRPTRRLSSPPPPSNYEPRVSFDTFDNKDAAELSYTLKTTHKDYVFTRRSRTFLCGLDANEYSEFALDWLLDELVEDGDDVVCLRVVDKDSKMNSEGSRESGRYRAAAQEMLERIQGKVQSEEGRAISLTLEYSVGKVHEIFQRTIATYEPACLVVGTRGRSLNGLQGLLPGSVSKYCLQNSPVPVVVVRPGAKREKKKKKRLADPSRRSYADVMSFDGTDMAGHVLRSPLPPEPAADDDAAGGGGGGGNSARDDADAAREAAAVARAIGIPGRDSAINILRGGSRSRPSSRAPSERDEGETLRQPAVPADSPSPTTLPRSPEPGQSPRRTDAESRPETPGSVPPSPKAESVAASPELRGGAVEAAREGVAQMAVNKDAG